MSERVPMADNVARWIAASVLVALVPHVAQLPPWMIALIVASIGLRLRLRRPPGRWLLVPVVVLSLAAVLFQYRSLAGANAGGAFFAAMVALKFLESRDRRDAGLMICLTYFLATSVFLTDQSIAIAAWVLLSIFLTTLTLITHAAPDGPPPLLRARRAGLLLVQALPIMLILFLLFPRISTPLWGLPQQAPGARTGLDDQMTPGSISDLLLSSEVAFRVQFEDELPAPADRYWRGPVFWHYDGRTWTRGKRLSEDRPALDRPGGTLDYTLILEPHGRPWVLSLDMPVNKPTGTSLTAGHNLVSRNRVESVRRFVLRSSRSYRLEPALPPVRRLRALQIPADAAPRAQALARDWRRESDSADAVIRRALTFFREQDFVYTLRPPILSGDPVDQFLFESRQGFCEHYAGAFVLLMRAAGLPARVVTGYQGGEINRLGEYLIVRQSDAHAWAEVWLPQRGWIRIDPTSAVSPQRIELGIGNVAGAGDRLGGMSLPGSGLWREAALLWDSVNHGWNRLVLGYGPDLQQRLLRHLGLDALGRYALVLLMIFAAGAALVAVWLLGEHLRPHRDPVLREWQRVRARLRRSGLAAPRTEGAATVARRVSLQRPELARSIGRIARLYNALRYRRSARPGDLDRLRREVRRFRPRRRRRAGPDGQVSASDPSKR